MLSEDDRRAPDLRWPPEYDRTPAEDREPYPGDLEPTRKESFQSIADELERWGATDVRISTASTHYADRPNVPHQHDRPDDVGVAVYYRLEDQPADQWHARACDRWETQRENARAIALGVRRERLAERCGVAKAESTHATTALPSGDEDERIAVAPNGAAAMDRERAAELLGVRADADEDAIRGAAERKIRTGHPDQGGDADVAALKRARDVLLEE